MKLLKIIVIVTIIFAIVYLSIIFIFPENSRTRIFGSTMEVNVEPEQKVIMATFKGEDLFYLTEPMDSNYIPKVKTLHEKSNRGIIESTVKFIESK